MVDVILKTQIRPSVVFDTYWYFASERQKIFMKRVLDKPRPWSDDPILSRNKFTNAYRASDRVSQYLIRNVIYSGKSSLEDTVFRVLLFKLFNKIETWELLESTLGAISYKDFDVRRYSQILDKAFRSKKTIYSSAYLMPPAPNPRKGARKHATHLMLLEKMMDEGLPQRIADARTLKQVYELLLNYPSIGPFLAYQYTIDLNYCEHLKFSEMEFVVAGPGAKDGIRKCFTAIGGITESELIKWVTERQQEEFSKRGIQFVDLWGRPLQLIDIQNLFCEVDKYSRERHPDIRGISGRTRIKQRFSPKPELVCPWYPPKWGINERIGLGVKLQKANSEGQLKLV